VSAVLALTFWQEIAKSGISAAVAAVLAVVGGYFAADRWGARRDHEREEIDKRLQERALERELRSDLATRTISVAATMYVACQHGARQGPGLDTEALDRAYLAFSVDSRALMTVLDIRYQHDGDVPADRGEDDLDPLTLWHQIRDLLTLYYFALKRGFPGDVLQSNARGHQGGFHSGLDTTSYFPGLPDSGPTEEELEAFLVAVRQTYEATAVDLGNALLDWPLRRVVSDPATSR
jgi:hypothetical protein